jgi:hypothetical protein
MESKQPNTRDREDTSMAKETKRPFVQPTLTEVGSLAAVTLISPPPDGQPT